MLRWQRIGAASHAVVSGHQPVAGEIFRALCERRFEVGDREVQPFDPEPLGLACLRCGEVVADMQDQSSEVTSMRVDQCGTTYEPEDDPAIVVREDFDEDQEQDQ